MALETSQERQFKRYVRGPKNVYINEYLTAYRASLFKKVRNRRRRDWKFWTTYHFGKIFVKPDHIIDVLVKIQRKEDPNKLQPKLCRTTLKNLYHVTKYYLSNDYFQEFRVNISMFLDCTHARLNHSNPRNKFIFRLNSVPRSSIILSKD